MHPFITHAYVNTVTLFVGMVFLLRCNQELAVVLPGMQTTWTWGTKSTGEYVVFCSAHTLTMLLLQPCDMWQG